MENKDSNQVNEVRLLPAITTGIKRAIKSWANNDLSFTGEGILSNNIEDSLFTQTWFERLVGNHSFNRQGLRYLVDTGYTMNPIGFSIINRILNCQSNINFIPYWKGKPYLSKTFNLDMEMATLMYLTCGTIMLRKKEIVGFPPELEVLNNINVDELYVYGKLKYRVYNLDGTFYMLNEEDIIFIKFKDITAYKKTNLGLSPLQAAIMPIESLKEMYTADTAMLKNKGVDGMVTNDSEEPIRGIEQDEFDLELNKRISGARRMGAVATSTKKLRFVQFGKTVKELALWDGYKIKLRDLCNVLQVDSGQFNDPDNKKFSNVIESNKALYQDCVLAFTKKITTNKEVVKFLGYEIYLDTSGIDCLQEAQSTRALKAQSKQSAIIELNTNVGSGNLTYDTAVIILVSEWDYSEEEAKDLIKKPTEQTNTSPSE